MQQYGQDALYLEPGEIAALATLARRAVTPGAPTHPNALLLAALAKRLTEMADGPGVVMPPAPPAVVHQAAQAYIRRPADEHVTPSALTPAGAYRTLPA